MWGSRGDWLTSRDPRFATRADVKTDTFRPVEENFGGAGAVVRAVREGLIAL